ncbi:MAG: hypothetical protein HQK79_15060 [Desulfobacterales bacterium]|nr:hypothetical protein [Desulfobacterales bacterium]MBF0395720.1 hypothetical protein [Desulfobacterales bacterium]
MENLDTGSLKINLKQNGNKVTMTWEGESDSRNPMIILTPYFDNLLPELNEKELIIDYTQLKYMNSSTVAPIIQFVKKIDNFQINTIILYDGNSKWQTASFKALQTLSAKMKYITVKGKTP